MQGFIRTPRTSILEVSDVHIGSYQRNMMSAVLHPRLWVVGGILAVAVYCVLLNRTQVPYVQRSQVLFFPLSLDTLIGDGIYDKLRLKVLSEDHPTAVRARQTLSRLLVAMKEDSEEETTLQVCADWDWSLCITADAGCSAFSLPGGKLVATQGLVEKLSNAQLGFILGHEMGHAIARHGTEKRVFWYLRRSLSEFVAAGSDVSQLLHSWAIDFPYSRAVESEADLIGLYLATSAGFSLSEEDLRLALQEGHHTHGEAEVGWSLLRTHPDPLSRVAVLRAQIPEVVEVALQRKAEAQALGHYAFHAMNASPLATYRPPKESEFVELEVTPWCLVPCGVACECGGIGCCKGPALRQWQHALLNQIFFAAMGIALLGNVCCVI